MTDQQRNERIAEKVLGWKRDLIDGELWRPGATMFDNDDTLPDFSDPATGMMLVAGLNENKNWSVDFHKGHSLNICHIRECEDDDYLFIGIADTPHAALLAAIDEWLDAREGE